MFKIKIESKTIKQDLYIGLSFSFTNPLIDTYCRKYKITDYDRESGKYLLDNSISWVNKNILLERINNRTAFICNP